MTTDIDICARALVTLGDNPITSFDASEGENAVICSNVYPLLKLDIMSKYPWRHLMRKRELTRDSEAPANKWKYSYVIPGESISAPHAIFQNENDDLSSTQYEVFGKRIFTDYERVFADIIVDVPETEWPGFFIGLMVTCTIAEICYAVTDQVGLAERWMNKAYGTPAEMGIGGAMGDAMAIDAQSGGTVGIEADAFTQDRRGI